MLTFSGTIYFGLFIYPFHPNFHNIIPIFSLDKNR